MATGGQERARRGRNGTTGANLAEFERLFRQRGLLNCAPSHALLAADSAIDQDDGGDGRNQADEGSDPPRTPGKIDGHLQSKKRSHEEKAGAEEADLRARAGVELPIRALAGLGPAGLGLTGNDTLRVELNPASRES